MDTTWIVTANAARARICARQADGTLTELTDLVHPQSRQPASDLSDDRAGRSERGVGGAAHGHTAYEAPTAARDKEHDRFARELAGHLNAAVADGHCDALVLLAAPAFLGVLRQHLGAAATKAVQYSEAGDLTALPLHELRARVDALLPTTR